MTLSTAIESAIYDLITAQEIGANTLVRCWHGLRKDTKWDFSIDRTLPCIDIRCSPDVPDESKSGFSARCAIKIWTGGEKDKSHEDIAKIEDAIHSSLKLLYKAFYAGATATVWTTLEASIKSDYPLLLSIGGIDIEQGDEPQDDDGNPTVGFIVVIHGSETD